MGHAKCAGWLRTVLSHLAVLLVGVQIGIQNARVDIGIDDGRRLLDSTDDSPAAENTPTAPQGADLALQCYRYCTRSRVLSSVLGVEDKHLDDIKQDLLRLGEWPAAAPSNNLGHAYRRDELRRAFNDKSHSHFKRVLRQVCKQYNTTASSSSNFAHMLLAASSQGQSSQLSPQQALLAAMPAPGSTAAAIARLRACTLDHRGRLHRAGMGMVFLQVAFVRLHNLVLRHQIAPLFTSLYGEGRGGAMARGEEYDKSVIPRYGFLTFFRKNRHRIPPSSVCLCWDDCAKLYSIGADARCMYKHVFLYAPMNTSHHRKALPVQVVVDAGGVEVGGGGAGARGRARRVTLRGDLTRMAAYPKILSKMGLAGRYGFIMCQEVFEHLPQPFEAAKALYALLKPGGILFWSAPFLARTHAVPYDYFRYTADGARQLFTDAGFVVDTLQKVGDTVLASGYVLSFGTGDFDEQWLHSHLLGNVTEATAHDPSEWLYSSVVLVARKPPGR